MRQTYAWSIATITALTLLFFWIQVRAPHNWTGNWPPLQNYQTLTDALLRGDLSLAPAPQWLLELRDPYNRKERAEHPQEGEVWDLSLFAGKLYLYFGIAPVLAFFLPYKALFDQHLPSALVVFLSCSGALIVAAGLLWRVSSRMKAAIALPPLESFLAFYAPFLVLGCGGMQGVLLGRTHIYELAISCGALFVMIALFALVREHEAASPKWRILAGACAGLAVGCRPHLGVGLSVLFLYSFACHYRERSLRENVVCATQLLAPFVLFVGTYAVYNWARFGNPLEFGVHYQLGVVDPRHTAFMSWQYLGKNLVDSFFAAPSHLPYFPWLGVVDQLISAPADARPALIHVQRLSVFMAIPFTIWSLYYVMYAYSSSTKVPAVGRIAFTYCFAFAVSTLITLASFFAMHPRYLADYALPLCVAASIGWLQFWCASEEKSGLPQVLRMLSLLALFVSIYFGAVVLALAY
ncbi:MAG: hypothetical protein J0M12_10705 [Deltaproteobacteria bacterium]|nr:hypothetical protein [Deltaproteobacteria bacterium]